MGSFLESQVVSGRQSIEGLHRALVMHLKRRCDANLHFCNWSCNEFYKAQMTPLKEPLDKEARVKLKIDLLHQIKVARFVEHKKQMGAQPGLERRSPELAKALAKVEQFPHLLRVHPKYKAFWRERVEDSFLFEALAFHRRSPEGRP